MREVEKTVWNAKPNTTIGDRARPDGDSTGTTRAPKRGGVDAILVLERRWNAARSELTRQHGGRWFLSGGHRLALDRRQGFRWRAHGRLDPWSIRLSQRSASPAMPIEASLAARGNEHGIAEVPDAGERAFERALAYGEAAGTALAETLWPTRCAVCDTPGEAVCQACLRSLPYLDWWRACPRCGAPFGRVQCSECNPVTMAALDRHELPFDACASAVVYNDATARIVRAWKDAGERRLVETLADLMASVTAPSWRAERPTIVPVPATAAALRRRGFDHGADLARALAERLSLDEIPLLARPRSFDQRSLARSGAH